MVARLQRNAEASERSLPKYSFKVGVPRSNSLSIWVLSRVLSNNLYSVQGRYALGSTETRFGSFARTQS
jgi:hypothetical protein